MPFRMGILGVREQREEGGPATAQGEENKAPFVGKGAPGNLMGALREESFHIAKCICWSKQTQALNEGLPGALNILVDCHLPRTV